MKRRLLVAAVLLLGLAFLVSASDAQTKKGESVITAGLGLGYPGGYGTMGMPPVFVAFDHAVAPRITAGGIASFSTSSYEWGGINYKWSYTYIFIGGRGAYHFGEHIQGLKNTDLYGGLTLGYHIVSAKFDGADEHLHPYNAGGSYFGFGIFVGGRYYFSPKWAATAELGYDIGFLKVGVSYKL
jgi:hypothetical protein